MKVYTPPVPRKTSKPERLECPECAKSLMIMHKQTLIKKMKYVCPNCKAEIETTPPREPPKQPTLPPGFTAKEADDAPTDAVAKAA